MAIVSAFMGRFDLAMLHSEQALALNPNNQTAAENLAAFQTLGGQHDAALRSLDSLLMRDPFPNATYWEIRGITLFQLRRYQEAIDAFGLIPAPQFWERAYVVAALAHSGRPEEACRQAAELMSSHPGLTISRVLKNEIYSDDAARSHFVDGMRKAGMPD